MKYNQRRVNKMRITVFTPTYNRGYIIENLYHSLKRQTFHDFEWIVVDDGSIDDSKELFSRLSREDSFFPIQYIRVENGGKHRAINIGVSLASGELFLTVDSDDYLADDALEKIDRIEKTIQADERGCFCGVCGQKGYSSGVPIGKTYQGDILDITVLERPKYHIDGDKAEVFYTEILRQYPFPEFEGENFMTECVVWDKIASDGYKMRFFNDIIMICNYLEDGLTVQGNSLLYRNPKGYGLYIYQSIKYGKLTGMRKWNELLDFYGALRNQHGFFEIANDLHMNPIVLWIRLFGLRVFYKLYGRW